MNALELADALDWVCENHLVGIGDADFKATAAMLRQQQERIKQLEETQEYLYKTHDADKAQIEALKRPNNVVGVPADKLAEMQAEIEALKKELKRYAEAIGEERGNKALRNNEIGKILTKVLDDCGLLKKASEK